MLRPRRPGDLDSCVALLREVHLADGYPMVWPADPAGWIAGRDNLATWVAEEDGTVLGHLALHRVSAARTGPPWSDALPVPVKRRAVVSRLFVSTRARARGIGGALMTRAEEYAAERDLRLILDVALDNRPSIEFYERRGWRRAGTAELPLSSDPWTLRVAVLVLD